MFDRDLLSALEELEAEYVNLGIYAARVTAEDLCVRLEQRHAGVPVSLVAAGLNRFRAAGEVIEWRPGCFRSRIGETARLLRLLRQRLWTQGQLAAAPLLIEDLRVEFRRRRRPDRGAVALVDVLPSDLPAGLGIAFAAAVRIPSVSNFQAEAIRSIYARARAGNPEGDAFVISGDTGAGKTEAFLFPILLDVVAESPTERATPGVRAVFVYPRIRLARNQLGRVLRYTGGLAEHGGPQITVGIQNGDTPRGAAEVANWPAAGTRRQVELLEGCVACDTGHYTVDPADPQLESGCPVLRCQACGHELRNLLLTQESLRTTAPDLLIITDVSLHQWLARPMYSHLWGLWAGDSRTVPPRFLVLDEVHLYEQVRGAHIARLVKRFVARSRLAMGMRNQPNSRPVVMGVSATLQDERRFLAKLMDVAPGTTDYRERLHVIRPVAADLQDSGGRERYLFLYPRGASPTPNSPRFRVNDTTAAIQTVMALVHNLRPKAATEWRAVAFFDSINDLRQFGYNYDGTTQRGEFPPANQAELWAIRTRHDCGGCDVREREATLHACPHFAAGDCWTFSRNHGCDRRLVVASAVYAGAAATVDRADLVPTSSVLEVGYDDEAIQLVYQHKGPSGPASFIQRRGRAGRRPEDSPVIATLLWPYKIGDAFYFFRPEALYAPAFDDIPLNASNFQVQRTHALLAFFDLLAAFQRQNLEGLGANEEIPDFTQAGWHHFPISPTVVPTFQTLNDPKRQGEERIRYSRADGSVGWFSGKPISDGHAVAIGGRLWVRGWLAMAQNLTASVLQPAWDHVNRNGPFEHYLTANGIITEAFRRHDSYPFRPGASGRPEQFLAEFGTTEWHHGAEERERGNWVKTFRRIDWGLSGADEATTLTVHYPDPATPGEELTVPVTFGLTELLPGNVSFRLRDRRVIHWTPVAADGESTFRYPTGYKPPHTDLARGAESLFGVPRFLDDRFPGLRVYVPQRVRVEEFGPADRATSTRWFYDENREVVVPDPSAGLPVARRSAAQGSSVIVPFVAASRRVQHRNLGAPLDQVFAAVQGYLEEGAAELGYTRVFYENSVRMRLTDASGGRPAQVNLTRQFFPPTPQRNEAGHPIPVLFGFEVRSHGLRFDLNNQLLDEVVRAARDDNGLRMALRRRCAVYRFAGDATRAGRFAQSAVEAGQSIIDHWLHQVVPASPGVPRLPGPTDADTQLDYFREHRHVRQTEVDQFRVEWLTPEWVGAAGRAIEFAYRGAAEFDDFVRSVLLHSLVTLLRRLVGRLGGIGGDELVAYADLPLLKNVDRATSPRILLIERTAGGTGGVAQAFDRLEGESEGSLGWMLRQELGQCPVAAGEALLETVLTRTDEARIRQLQADGKPEALTRLLEDLRLTPLPAAVPVLSRALFGDLTVGTHVVNPALIRRELLRYQSRLDSGVAGGYPRAAVARRGAEEPAGLLPQVATLREALRAEGVAGVELTHELAQQLRVLHEHACEDGCPVCLGGGSDLEQPALAPLLNSRRLLERLRSALTARLPRAGCLAEVADLLARQQAVRVEANPGALAERPQPRLGLSVTSDIGPTGEVEAGTAAVTDPAAAADFFARPDAWAERWGDREHRHVLTRDGNRVRSRAEALIANWLSERNIAYEYEPALAYRDDSGHTRHIHPDFHLYEYGLYVEYWGRDDAEYIESRAFKERVYRRRRIDPVNIERDEVDSRAFEAKILARIRQAGG
jgi:hypothetical protein